MSGGFGSVPMCYISLAFTAVIAVLFVMAWKSPSPVMENES